MISCDHGQMPVPLVGKTAVTPVESFAENPLNRENSRPVPIREGHRRRGRRRYNVVSRCSGGVPTVAYFSPLVRRDAHQKVSQLSPGCTSLAAPENTDVLHSYG